jgi:ribosomal small subunit protein bTHX
VAVTVEAESVTCGRGDKKTKRGKRFKGSFGNARPKNEKKIERIKDRVEVLRVPPLGPSPSSSSERGIPSPWLARLPRVYFSDGCYFLHFREIISGRVCLLMYSC